PSLSTEAVARRPRWLIGFSDTTALHGLWQRAGIVSVHGANVTTLASWDEEARRELFGMLMGVGGASGYVGATVQEGAAARVTGPLIGGNLTVLASLAGTGHLPSFEGAIAFFEDIGERP